MRTLLYVALSIVVAPPAAAEVFAYESAGRQFEAEVTPERLTLREKRDSAADAPSLDCPLGSAVRANVVPAGPNSTKVCLVFSKQQCAYGDNQRAGARGASGSFRCIEFAEAQQAETLAALINAGPQSEAGQEPLAPAPAAERPAPKGAPARAATEPGSPASSPFVPGNSPKLPANAASPPKSSTSVRKPNGPSASGADKSVVTNQAAQPARKPAAAGPQPAAVDRSNGEVRPDDKRGRLEGAERSAQVVTPGEHDVGPKFSRTQAVQSGWT